MSDNNTMLNNIPEPQQDAIFLSNGIASKLKSENKLKINGGNGILTNPDGSIYMPLCVKEVMKNINYTVGYGKIRGDESAIQLLENLFFNNYSFRNQLYSTLSYGGTHALQLASEYLKIIGITHIFIPESSWPNHEKIFCDFHIITYCHKELNIQKIINEIDLNNNKYALLFHGTCHNPSGVNNLIPNDLILFLNKNDCVLICDYAYPALCNGLEKDNEIICKYIDKCKNIITCISLSKIFGLYGQRVGLMSVHSKIFDKKSIEKSKSVLENILRKTVSNIATTESHIINNLLSDDLIVLNLKKDIDEIHIKLRSKRLLLQNELIKNNLMIDVIGVDFEKDKTNINDIVHSGLFCILPLNSKEIDTLAYRYGIILVDLGNNEARLNICAINESNVEYFVSSLCNVLNCV